MLELAFGTLFLLAALALNNWRMGFTLCVVMVVLQDVLRKLIPGEPAYFVLFSGVLFAAAALGAMLTGKRLTPDVILGWKSQMGKPFVFFLILVGLQAVHSLALFQVPQMTVIGLIAYLAPIPAIVFAYQFALRTGLAGMRFWMWSYVLVVGTALLGVYLEYMGVDWKALGEVGTGLTIYDVGTVLKAYSGFFRSSEIAAWHTAAVSCYLFILLIGRRITLPRLVFAIALVMLLASLGVLTGRRKLLVMLTVFLSVYFFAVLWFRKHQARPALFIAATGLLAYVAVIGLMAPDGVQSETKQLRLNPADRYQHYTVRGETVFGDVPKRFEDLGLRPVLWAVDSYGVFGAGLGTGSQGVQHVEGTASINRGAAEGGLGKITMELGVPGLFLMAWVMWAFYRFVRKLLDATTKLSRQHAQIAYGLLAFLVANGASFLVATQAYGDVFVLLMMGWAGGFLLAMPVLATRDIARSRQRATQGKTAQNFRPVGKR